MNSVVAELAELRLTMQQASEQIENLDRRIADSRNEMDKEQPASSEELTHSDLIERAQKYLLWGRRKSATLDNGNGLFADSCWNMCLDIYICGLKEERVTVSSIAHSSGIPMTTAMRYINVMVEQGLIQKTQNPDDNRMTFVSVSPDCMDRIRTLLCDAPF